MALAIVTVLLVVTLLTGCASYQNWSVLNNTGYKLVVIQDGKPVKDLQPGECLVLKGWVTQASSSVAVSAFSSASGVDQFVGANSYTFHYQRPYIWQVDNVDRPGGAR